MTKRLIFFIAIIGALLAGSFIFVLPKYRDFKDVILKFQQKEAELNSKMAYYSEINKTWRDFEKYEDVLAKVDSAVPRSYSLPAMFNYLQKTAGETGLVLENLASSDLVNSSDIKEIGINLQMSGDYPSFKNFLSALENSERFFSVKSARLSSPKGKDGKFTFNLGISTYSY